MVTLFVLGSAATFFAWLGQNLDNDAGPDYVYESIFFGAVVVIVVGANVAGLLILKHFRSDFEPNTYKVLWALGVASTVLSTLIFGGSFASVLPRAITHQSAAQNQPSHFERTAKPADIKAETAKSITDTYNFMLLNTSYISADGVGYADGPTKKTCKLSNFDNGIQYRGLAAGGASGLSRKEALTKLADGWSKLGYRVDRSGINPNNVTHNITAVNGNVTLNAHWERQDGSLVVSANSACIVGGAK
jgi:hypothetical protein